MGCPVLLECFFENISPGKAFRALIIFIASFLVIFLYLNSSEFTAWTTALWTSFLIALFYTAGIVSNVYCRCAALVFFVHLFFSKFGLLMMFISSSWMTLQMGLGAYRKNQKLENKILMDLDEEDIWNPNLAFVDDILGTIHYFSLLPYLCNYLYSFLYEVTFECRRIERRSGEDPHGSLFYLCVRLCKYLICVLVGGCALVIVGVYFCQWHNYENLVAKFINKEKDPSVLVSNPKGWAIFYFVFCIGLIVLSTFSRYLLKFRKTIIRNYFDFTPRNIRTRVRHNYMTKPGKKRKALKRLQKRNKKTPERHSKCKSESDDDLSNCIVNIEDEEAIYRARKQASYTSPQFDRADTDMVENKTKWRGKGRLSKQDYTSTRFLNDDGEQSKYFIKETNNVEPLYKSLEAVSRFDDEDGDIAQRLEKVCQKVNFDTSSDSDDSTHDTRL